MNLSIFVIDSVYMNIQQLEYVIAVDKFRNFTRAADHCNVTQATLSAMVKKLEDELGVMCFDRRSVPLRTTEAGIQVVEEARAVVAHCEKIRSLAKGIGQKVEGRIRIGVIPTIANSLLPKIIRPLLEKYPKLHVEVAEVTTQHIYRQLREGSIDVGIIGTPNSDPDIGEEVLYYEALMVYGDVDKKMSYIIPDEIRNNKIWLWEEGHCLREQFVNLCSLRKKDLRPHNLSFDANSFDTILNMVDEFGGLTLIPELYYQSLPKARKQKVHYFKSPIPVREVSLVYYKPYARERQIQAIASFIHGKIKPGLVSGQYKNRDLFILGI